MALPGQKANLNLATHWQCWWEILWEWIINNLPSTKYWVVAKVTSDFNFYRKMKSKNSKNHKSKQN
jgi:hypothetical protein